MSIQALDQPDSVPTTTKTGRKQRISKSLRHACELLGSGECKTVKAAAERVGLSREHLSRMLSTPHVQAFIAQESRRTIAAGTMRASARLLELLDARSEHVSLDASKHVLACEGIRPPENGTNVNIINNIQPGYVIRLAVGEGASLTTPDQRIEPKPLIEHESVRSVGPIPYGTSTASKGDSDA